MHAPATHPNPNPTPNPGPNPNPTPKPNLVRDVDLALYAGEQLAVTGPSGCGKSTLLRCLALLSPLGSGSLELRGRPSGATPAPSWRSQVCYVAQTGAGSLPGTPRSLAQQLARLARSLKTLTKPTRWLLSLVGNRVGRRR